MTKQWQSSCHHICTLHHKDKSIACQCYFMLLYYLIRPLLTIKFLWTCDTDFTFYIACLALGNFIPRKCKILLKLFKHFRWNKIPLPTIPSPLAWIRCFKAFHIMAWSIPVPPPGQPSLDTGPSSRWWWWVCRSSTLNPGFCVSCDCPGSRSLCHHQKARISIDFLEDRPALAPLSYLQPV